MRTETITIYKFRPWRRPAGEWRWRWKAANGLMIGASTEGYANRADAIANLERITGGVVAFTYRDRLGGAGEFCQGTLRRLNAKTNAAETIFVQVTP